MARGWLLVVWLVGVGSTGAQTRGRTAGAEPKGASGAGPADAVSASAASSLVALGSRAGVIFAGHVVKVTREDDAGFVDVEFAVDRAVRGCGGAKTYVLREWAGLWKGQVDRYLVGQRRLMILAGRGPSGMSAPVGGLAGVIPIVSTREPPLVRGTGAAPADTALEDRQEEAVDLRWVEALGVRSAGWSDQVRSDDEPQPIRRTLPVRPPHLPVLVPGAAGSPGPSLSAVLALLGAS